MFCFPLYLYVSCYFKLKGLFPHLYCLKKVDFKPRGFNLHGFKDGAEAAIRVWIVIVIHCIPVILKGLCSRVFLPTLFMLTILAEK